MNPRTLSPMALAMIDKYFHFQMGPAVCSVPYYNNKTRGRKMTLRAYVGKGKPEEIRDELQTILVKQHLSTESLSDEALKKILTDNGMGIDCSGFAYYILNAESESRNSHGLSRQLSFVTAKGLKGALVSKFRPAENCSVAVLAHEHNSHIVPLAEIQPGDMITMMTTEADGERNHILVVSQVESHDSSPVRIQYVHSVAYPEDGVYGTGIKQGLIDITDLQKSILNQRWIENNLEGEANRIFVRAKKSQTELRRLKWF
jgi:hypothetical protein